MAFMQPEYTEDKRWWQIDGSCGIALFPAEMFSREQAICNYDGTPFEVEETSGFGVRLSAPGYMDCTEWDVFDSIKECRDFVEECWEVDPDTGDALEDSWDKESC